MDKTTKKTSELNLFPEIFSLDSVSNRKLEVSFTAPDLSSQGGLLLLREFDQRTGIINRLSNCLIDTRSQYLIRHSYEEMLRQRIFQIAAGYEDADDCDLLRDDSLLKICAGKAPDSLPLSSQPTMTRLENNQSIKELYDMGLCFVEEFMNSYGEEPECIILDCDDSNFDAYGAQQGTLFNNYYDEYCYMPLFIFEGISGKMILPLLRSGRRNKSTNIFGILRRLIEIMREKWKNTRFIVRGDGHFCSKEFMDWSTKKSYVDFVFGLSGNSVLSGKTKEWSTNALAKYKKEGKDIVMFRNFYYKAGSWKHKQHVVVKIEINSHGLNVRYIVTSFKHDNSRFLYQSLYCGRGVMELYIKELKTYLAADRTSCNKFSANQFRLFLHAAAYVLLHGIKQEVFKGTFLYNVSILTFRQKILLSAVHIKTKKTKITIEFHKDHPFRNELSLAFQRYALWRGAA